MQSSHEGPARRPNQAGGCETVSVPTRGPAGVDPCFWQEDLGDGVEILVNTRPSSVLGRKSFPGLQSALQSGTDRRDDGDLCHLAIVARRAAPMLVPQLASFADRIGTVCLFGEAVEEPDTIRPTMWHRGWKRLGEPGTDECARGFAEDSSPRALTSVGAVLDRAGAAHRGSQSAARYEKFDDIPFEVAIVTSRYNRTAADRVFASVSDGLVQTSMVDLDPASDASGRPASPRERHGNLASSIMQLSTFCDQNGLKEAADDLMAKGLRHLILRES